MTQRKKICFMITTLTLGGAERVLSNLANKFALLPDWDVYFITKYPSKDEYELHKNIKRINIFDKEPKGIPFFIVLKQLMFIRKVCKTNRIDILVNFMAASNLKGILSTLGLKTKCIISVRDDPSVAYGKIHLEFLAKLCFPMADGIVFQTHDEASWFGQKIMEKGIIIPNPVNKKFFLSDNEYNEIRERKNIVAVGRLESQKNHKMLIEGFARIIDKYPNERLVIYGRGSKYDELNRIIMKNKLENKVYLAGEVHDVHERVKKAKLFVMTSNHEGIPNAMLEAMALGLPVICTDCPAGGPREYINNGVDGVLIKVGNVESLVSAMKTVLDNDNLRKELGRNARKKAEIFSEQIVFDKWYKYILEGIKK